MKYIVFPLIILIAVAMLSMLGLGATQDVTITLTLGDASGGYYDADDHLVAYRNGTAVDDEGTIENYYNPNAGSGPWERALVWDNGTEYNVYDYTGQRVIGEVTTGNSMNLYSTVGLIAIVSAILIGGSLIGLNFLGIGLTDISVKFALLGTILITIWGIFSVLSYSAITSIPLIGVPFYFILTAIYTLGMVEAMGGSGN